MARVSDMPSSLPTPYDRNRRRTLLVHATTTHHNHAHQNQDRSLPVHASTTHHMHAHQKRADAEGWAAGPSAT